MTKEQLNDLFFLEKSILIKELLGKGSSAQTYRIEYYDSAKQTEHQVLKVVDVTEQALRYADGSLTENEIKSSLIKLYQREQELHAKLTACRCEYLVPILEPYRVIRDSAGICIFAMRMPYYDMLQSLDMMSESMVIRLGTHICEALSVLHHDIKDEYYKKKSFGFGAMIHMDVKPSNIFYRKEGENLIFMLGDFGMLAEKFHPQIFGGTPGYIAPEFLICFDENQNSGEMSVPELSENTDLFSLGITLYDCLVKEDRNEATIPIHNRNAKRPAECGNKKDRTCPQRQ